MKILTTALALLLVTASPLLASTGLDAFIDNINVEARIDLGDFKVGLASRFGVPSAQVETVFKSAKTPGDAYMCLRIGQVASLPVDRVLKEYKANKGKGWGVIAKNLGIKPGSAPFKALKEGGSLVAKSGKRKKGEGKLKGKKH